MNTIFACVTLLLMTSSIVSATICMPGVNCKPPNCRCWSDRNIPGNLDKTETPQIVLITFGNSINRDTKKYALDIMKGLKNPNGCPARATVFIEQLNTVPQEVLSLYNAGYEVALSNRNDTVPQSPDDWLDNIARVKDALKRSGIPSKELRGFRGAQLYAGGDEALDAFNKLDLLYDSSCVNKHYTQEGNLLWPYTYDFPDHAPACSIGRTPRKSHNGTWQVLMPDLQWEGHNCPSPSSCRPYFKAKNVTYPFLFRNFVKHYNGNKAPFNLYLDPLWLTNPNHFKGTRAFLELIDAVSDAWMLTVQQALDWMKDPMDKHKSKYFKKWGCDKSLRFKPHTP